MNHRPGHFSIHPASDMFIRGAYAIRPYPDGRKIATISIRSAHNDQKIATILIHLASDMSIRKAYAIRPYPDGRKIATILIRLPHSDLKIDRILIHRQKMILKLTGIIYPRAIRKINPDAYTFLFV